MVKTLEFKFKLFQICQYKIVTEDINEEIIFIDDIFINSLLKVACRRFLSRCFYSKNGKRTLVILGYTTESLKQRLEYQFTKDMKPVSLFKVGTEMSIINALCNLRPVRKEENFSKQKRFIG